MPLEIERKFLVDREKWQTIDKPLPNYTKQVYLSKQQDTVVRVRIIGTAAFLTIKGKNNGIIRQEYEYGIPLEEANEIMEMSQEMAIEKNRYLIKEGTHEWEVDVFLGENKGLIIAEIELKHSEEKFNMPDWVTQEVSNETKYYNVNLVLFPFSKW